jgi:hypothetical protein
MSKPQTKPDFSGEWILNRPACTLSAGADAIRSATVQIDHTWIFDGRMRVNQRNTEATEF